MQICVAFFVCRGCSLDCGLNDPLAVCGGYPVGDEP